MSIRDSNSICTSELIEECSKEYKLDIEESKVHIPAILKTIKKNLEQGKSVKLHEVGTLSVVERKKTKKRVPKSKRTVVVPSHYAIKFNKSSGVNLPDINQS